MPVNKSIGNLWFKTQEEIDAYDDKMVANIVLKEDKDFNSPTFSLLAVRSKKEKFMEENDLAKYTRENYNELKKNEKPIFGSYKYFYELPIYTKLIGAGCSYLILRELPIRNFYARSFIMCAFFYKLAQNYSLDFKDFSVLDLASY